MSAGGAIGFDIGSHSSIIATVKQKSIDVVLNELTNRATPNVIGFSPKQRFIGEVGLSKLSTNFRNSVVAPSRFVGLTTEYIKANGEDKWLTNALGEFEDGTPAYQVSYQGEASAFTSQALAAMTISHLKDTVLRHGLRVSDVVIAVPAYYTDSERRAVIDAAYIADVPCVGLMNDTTAAALSYGIYRGREISNETPKTVAFVDMGHSKLSVAVAEFTTDKLQMLGKAFDRNLGARDFDWLFAKHVAAKFEAKHGVDPFTNPKSKLKLLTAVERLRKILSANSEGALHIEYLVEDIDLDVIVMREEFEEVCQEVLQRVRSVCQQAIESAGTSKISAVEILGGASRIPMLQNIFAEAFGVETCSKTLNAEEEIAKGCALQAAMLSPFFNVKKYSIVDITPYQILFASKPISDMDIEPEILELFTQKNVFPVSKIITLTQRGPFNIELGYAGDLPIGIPRKFARFSILAEHSTEDFRVKMSFKMNHSGIINLESAEKHVVYYEEVPVKEEVKSEESKTTTEEQKPATEEQKTTAEVKLSAETPAFVPKKKTKKTPVVTESQFYGLTPKQREDFKVAELHMKQNDKLAKDTLEKKNELESYVYESRDRVNGAFKQYLPSDWVPNILASLSHTENWLYEEGSDASKEVYTEKLEGLKSQLEPISSRYQLYESVPSLINSLRSVADSANAETLTEDPAKAHIAVEERQQVQIKLQETYYWLEEVVKTLETIDRTTDFPFSRQEFGKRENEILELIKTVMGRPAPPPPPPPQEEPRAEEPNAEGGNRDDQEPAMEVE